MKSIVENLTFKLIYDKCFLLISMKAKRFNLREPWYTKGLAKYKSKRYKLYIQVIPLIPLNLPLKMLISRTKTDLLLLFEMLSVYIMKNNFKNLNQILRPRGGY